MSASSLSTTNNNKKDDNESHVSSSSSSSSSHYDFSLWLQYQVVTLITNCSKTKLRVDPPWEDIRQPGWTETWGNLNHPKTTTTTTSTTSTHEEEDDDDTMVWIDHEIDHEESKRNNDDDDDDTIGDGNDKKNKKRLLKLIQYRVAWYEQLVLRVAQVPHEIQNSTFSCMESTGPLPVLQDIPTSNHNNDDSTTSSSSDVYWIGQNHPGTSNNNVKQQQRYHSHIVQHLIQQNYLTTTQELTQGNDNDETTVQTYLLWIQTVLQQQILSTARYYDDATWYHVEQPTCRLAASSSSSWWTQSSAHFMSGYQAWAERVVSLTEQQQQQSNNGALSLKQAIDLANDSYSMLEQKLQSNNNNNNNDDSSSSSSSHFLYLLGTKQPTLADCLLFDHLANALTNVHLIIILANYPKLVSYFQHLYQQYFDTTNNNNNNNDNNNRQYGINNQVNQCNAFVQQSILVDMLASSNQDESNSRMKRMKDNIPKCKTAVELMQSLALHHPISQNKEEQQQTTQPNFLVNVVKNVKEIRQSQEDILQNNDKNRPNPFSTIKRWLNGGDILAPTTTEEKKKKEEEEKQKRGRKKDDVYEEMNRKRRDQLKKLKQQSLTQDQIWISSVVLITGFTMFLGAARASSME